MTLHIGIDPGLDGAVAIIGLANDEITIRDMPTRKDGKKRHYDIAAMRDVLAHYVGGDVIARVMIEQVHAMPGQGVVAMFSMGHGLGVWEGLLVGLGLSYSRVTPQRWRKEMLAGFQAVETPKQRKEQSMLQAQRLFPRGTFTGPRGGALDGRADATLIAEFCRRTMGILR